MRTSSDRILTSHVGSLPRPDALIEANRAREAGEATDEPAFQQTLRAAVGDSEKHEYCYACYSGDYPTELVNIEQLMRSSK